MDSGYSTVRNLLYVVIVLVVFAILSNYYVASQIAHNSDELAGLRQLLAKQVMGNVLSEADEMRKRLDAVNESARGIDGRLQKAQEEFDGRMKRAQDDLIGRLRVELPKIMDDYIQQRAPLVQKRLEEHGVVVPKP